MANPRAADFIAARDFLLKHRTDYAAARAGFRWPVVREFNWALDYFDDLAAANDRPALRIVFEDGRDERLSFEDLRQRSNQVANWLRRLGVRQD
mgnify:CR=1 FL=1